MFLEQMISQCLCKASNWKNLAADRSWKIILSYLSVFKGCWGKWCLLIVFCLLSGFWNSNLKWWPYLHDISVPDVQGFSASKVKILHHQLKIKMYRHKVPLKWVKATISKVYCTSQMLPERCDILHCWFQCTYFHHKVCLLEEIWTLRNKKGISYSIDLI